MKWRIVSSVCLLSFLLATHAVADDAKAPDKKDTKEAQEEEKLSVTQHSIVVDDEEVKYTATVGKMAMKTDAGKTTAHVFSSSSLAPAWEPPDFPGPAGLL